MRINLKVERYHNIYYKGDILNIKLNYQILDDLVFSI